MTKLEIAPTQSTPKVVFDPSSNRFEVSGLSKSEFPGEFYEQITMWANENLKEPLDKMVFNIELIYMNSSSAKRLLEFFKVLQNHYQKGIDMEINWHHSQEDESIIESGSSYQESLEMPFNLIAH
jgi:hypothetical protein